MRLFYTISLLCLINCSYTKTDGVKVDSGEIYLTSGAEQFFLAELPYWANFSSDGACFRSVPIRYLNFSALKENYNLSYDQMLHLQLMFNRRLNENLKSTGQSLMSPKDEAYVFYNMYQKVIGGSYDFLTPRFKKLSLIWIDPYLSDHKKLVQVVTNEKVLNGFPVLVSECLTSFELEELARDLELDELGVRYFSAEMFSIFSIENKRVPYFHVDISEFFKGKEIQVFSSKEPLAIEGKYLFIKK